MNLRLSFPDGTSGEQARGLARARGLENLKLFMHHHCCVALEKMLVDVHRDPEFEEGEDKRVPNMLHYAKKVYNTERDPGALADAAVRTNLNTWGPSHRAGRPVVVDTSAYDALQPHKTSSSLQKEEYYIP